MVPERRITRWVTICVFLVAGGISYSRSQVIAPSAGVPYYPLAKGNSWKYEVHNSGKSKNSTVEWRVTGSDKTKEGIVFQVWPFPSQSDDEAMSLLISNQGVVETSRNTLILKYPATAGDSWATNKPTHRVFRVISAGHPCHVGVIESDDCLVVEDQDDALKFRTVTTYAKGIGPVLYVYYKKDTTSGTRMQTVELISYYVDSK
jgi:hypothetical protein